MTTVGERVRAERERQDLSRTELSRRTGIGYSTLAELENGGMKTTTRLRVIAEALGVSQPWLETGKGPKDAAPAVSSKEPDWGDVKAYAQAVGLGNGVEAQEYAETHKLKFRADSLSRKHLRPDKLAVMYGSGDSMLPRLKPGDAIMFDTSDVREVDGRLYVIQVHGAANAEYQVKRAMVIDDQVFWVADNPSGDHAWKKPRRGDARKGQIAVIGRVRWVGSWEE